ncbi:hypothetical protein E4U47_007058 [Claviceps purpurea]|nr:hypothetical protein E4U36_002219 [Claviceps purpurea]KAG6199622.1 hypothetical protein E4U10_004380 [Claviceps purpurea]KAG6277542.1 hypothetical protein E4U47_007058 [Claviceps purpurea]KAG6312355.1 hypothetical protein E4U44_003430 [Claviceps purpurea]
MPINGVTRDSTVDSGQKYEVGFEERNLQVCNLQRPKPPPPAAVSRAKAAPPGCGCRD